MAKRKNLKAYVRLDGSRKPIPGSLIYRQAKPYGDFVPLVNPSGDICCGSSCSNLVGAMQLERVVYNYPSGGTTYADMDLNCNSYLLYTKGSPEIPVSEEVVGTNFLYKRSPSGSLIWNKQINITVPYITPFDFLQNSLYQMETDRVRGITYIISSYLILAVDTEGNVLWCKGIDLLNALGLEIFSMSLSPDGNYIYLTGTYSIGGQDKVPVIKIDALTGDITKQVNLFYTADNCPTCSKYGVALSCTPNGDIFVAYTSLINANATAFTPALKLDADLNMLWASNTVTPNLGGGYVGDIKSDNTGNCYLSGIYDNSTAEQSMLKLDGQTGNIVWKANFDNGVVPSVTQFVLFDASDNAYVVAVELDYSVGAQSVRIIKLADADGPIEFVYTPLSANKALTVYWWYSPRAGAFVKELDKIILGVFPVPNPYPPVPTYTDGCYELRLPSTLVEGVYQDLTFTDLTGSVNITRSVPSLGTPPNITATINTDIEGQWQSYPAVAVDCPSSFNVSYIS